MNKRAKPWGQIANERYQDFQSRLPEVKKWRKREYDAERPSGLEDFFNAHGLCFLCKATGTRLDPVDFNGDTPLFEECPVCGGTGKLPAS